MEVQIRFKRRAPGTYVFDGAAGRYRVLACAMPRIAGRGSKTGWEVFVPGADDAMGVRVRNLDQARALVAEHESL